MSVALILATALAAAPPSPPAPPPRGAQDLRAAARETMLAATRYMVEKVSTRGGYVWQYLPDMSRRWGEMEAYESMIWLQPPGTSTMGALFLDAYQATGDEYYYQAAEKVGRALVWAQRECGGWNYVADFAGEKSLERWYATVGRNAWRLEEFQHYYGNATFDDHVTADATRFLLRLYLVKLDPAFRPALDRAIQFVLDSQYPNGGWPQRFPLRNEFSHHGRPDYTSFVTFNDDVAWENVRLLIDCYVALADPRLLDPIRRGMDVFLLTQQPAPQAGWAMQYTPDLKPAGARTYEPLALSPQYTAAHVRLLVRFYRLTGEARYLARIPEALSWLESCKLAPELTNGGEYTHPAFVEIGTGKPLFIHRRGSNVANGAYFADSDPQKTLGHYNSRRRIDLEGVRREYEAVAVLRPEDVTRDSPLLAPRRGAIPSFVTDDEEGSLPRADETRVRAVIAALDGEGRWLTRMGMTSHPYCGDGQPGPLVDAYASTSVGDETDTSPFPDRGGTQQYLSLFAYMRNMRLLMAFLHP